MSNLVKQFLREAYKRPDFQFIDDAFEILFKYYSNVKNKKLVKYDINSGLKTTENLQFLQLLFYPHIFFDIYNYDNDSPYKDLNLTTYPFDAYVNHQNIIVIKIPNNFLDYFSMGQKEIQRVRHIFLSSYAHEFSHIHQLKNSKIFKSIPKSSNDFYSKENEPYLRQKIEIDAYARDFAYTYLQYGFTIDDFKKMMRNPEKEVPLMLEEAIVRDIIIDCGLKQYFDKRLKEPEIWRRYMKRVWEVLEEESPHIQNKRFIKPTLKQIKEICENIIHTSDKDIFESYQPILKSKIKN
jgi:hypothetical protein